MWLWSAKREFNSPLPPIFRIEHFIKYINSVNFGFVYSVFGLDYHKYSHYLKATNFGFSIPEEATIDGIEVIVSVYQDVREVADVYVNNMQIKVYSPQGTWVSVDKR